MMSNRTALWYYGRKSDATIDEWIPYEDFHRKIIENAYQSKRNELCLDGFRLDLVNFIHYDLSNPTIQYSIFRLENHLREDRFFSSISSNCSSSHGSAQAGCPFLNAWLRSSAGKRAVFDFSTAVQACADGIRQEALLTEEKNQEEVNEMTEKLLALKKASRRDISQFCVYLYTRETFLYRVLNAALRDSDHSKLQTLGPLCFLIRNFGNAGNEFVGTVYRGVHFSSEVIESYKKSINQWRTWPSYTSTTKRREVAELRGNTLFIIQVIRASVSFAAFAFDIEDVSQFPEEKEVLLVAGITFQITNVDDSSSKKTLIEIKI